VVTASHVIENPITLVAEEPGLQLVPLMRGIAVSDITELEPEPKDWVILGATGTDFLELMSHSSFYTPIDLAVGQCVSVVGHEVNEGTTGLRSEITVWAGRVKSITPEGLYIIGFDAGDFPEAGASGSIVISHDNPDTPVGMLTAMGTLVDDYGRYPGGVVVPYEIIVNAVNSRNSADR